MSTIPPPSDDPICAKCGDEYFLRCGCEPTKYCDTCAQELVEKAEQRAEAAEQRCLDLSIKRVQTHGTAHCLYCGFTGERKLFEEARAETLEHGRTCDKHPMRAIEQRAEAAERDGSRLESELEKANSTLQRIRDELSTLQDPNMPQGAWEGVDYLTAHASDGWIRAGDLQKELVAAERERDELRELKLTPELLERMESATIQASLKRIAELEAEIAKRDAEQSVCAAAIQHESANRELLIASLTEALYEIAHECRESSAAAAIGKARGIARSAIKRSDTLPITARDRRIADLERELDPPVCRLQFPDGSVPGNAREAAEGWKRHYDELERELRKYADDPGGYLAVGGFVRRIAELEAANLQLLESSTASQQLA